MKYVFACATVALSMAMASLACAQEETQAGFSTDQSGEGVVWSDTLAQLDTGVQMASCDTCGPGVADLALLPTGRGNRLFVGGEALWVRANPSEAVAYLERDIPNLTDTFHELDFDYSSSFRVYGGIRNCCGEEVRFTYTRFDTDSGFESPAFSSTNQIISPLEQTPLLDGSRVVGTADIALNSFDIGWSKTIPLGSPLGCCDTGCGDCCDTCCDGWCPAWDITFTGAFRAVDFDTTRIYSTIDGSDELLERGTSVSDFQGAGGRVGLLGRRYLGRQGICSLYMKGDISLLVGDYSTTQSSVDYSGSAPVGAGTQTISGRRLIPVTEIEMGGTVFVTCNTSISGGYFFSAWHDLGFRDEYDFQLQTSYDDANIMGFDGFFLRAETAF
ncbi:hypothetical protein [Aeoliella mucimassa]|uniref:Uncharacterized protein n=1 Tax=Aeoliella mucimassa TaxID=2527972 RepID=A0A518AKY7_9BACT|nr:hypothetical protein [Aeoliella mucimassa]QDU55395.1 hypothetical protein Pan181_15840 [Aeoliella mucimassa]